MISARADVVGSLLRPPGLLEARERYAAGEISAAEFKRVEDGAVDWAIALQERAGLPVVTDGEMRRESFQSQLVDARSEEHTSELQSRQYLVCRLLLEKKKQHNTYN